MVAGCVLLAGVASSWAVVSGGESESESGGDGSRNAGIPNAVQSTARPEGLSIVSPVMQAGSDQRAATFQQTTLPSINRLLNVQLSETHGFNDSAHLLDPSKLKLTTSSDIRVYFVGEGAGYRNTLGFSFYTAGMHLEEQKLIFPDASSSVSAYDPASKAARTSTMPLLPGDFVNIGNAAAGTSLDFFLIANGAAGGNNTFHTTAASNPDHINHVVAFALPDSPFLILGFEDMYGGGDRDFNDVLIAVDIGARNIAALTVAPEPGLILILAAFVLLAMRFLPRHGVGHRGAMP